MNDDTTDLHVFRWLILDEIYLTCVILIVVMAEATDPRVLSVQVSCFHQMTVSEITMFTIILCQVEQTAPQENNISQHGKHLNLPPCQESSCALLIRRDCRITLMRGRLNVGEPWEVEERSLSITLISVDIRTTFRIE